MNAEELSDEIDVCRRLACTCRGICKQKPEVFYVPGCTILHCDCVKVVMPDWSPRDCLRVWNQAWLNERQEFNQVLADKLSEKYLTQRTNQ